MTAWVMSEGKISRGPYSIVRDSRGEFAVWFRADEHYGLLKRGFPGLAMAQKYCDEHAAKEAYQAKELGAVFTK